MSMQTGEHPPALDYGRAPSLRYKFRKRHLAYAIGFAAAVASYLMELRHDLAWVDATTGSMTHQTIWPLGLTHGPILEPSPLELRLRKMGMMPPPNLVFMYANDGNIYGHTFTFACNTSNIPFMFQAKEMLDDFAANASDGEIGTFIQTMQSGTPTQQKIAVEAEEEFRKNSGAK